MLASIKTFIVFGLLIIASSCASIVSRSRYPVTLDSTPRGASVTITDRHGIQVFSGVTPTMIKLKSSAGFFQNARYSVTITKPGFAAKTVELKATINGWYFGNLLFGGLLGMLIIDPATGAMYRLNTLDINETLQAENSVTATEKTIPPLRIYDINDVPESWKSKMQVIQ
jgi:hypothetical protein